MARAVDRRQREHRYGGRVARPGPGSGEGATRQGAARLRRVRGSVRAADPVLRGMGVGREPHGRAGGRLPAHLHDVELPVGAGAVRVLRRVLRARNPGRDDQPALRLQDGCPDGAGAGHGRRGHVLPGRPVALVRAVPRRAVRAGRRAVDPRDLGEPVRDRDGPRRERDPAAEPRAGVQPGRGEHRRAARRGTDPPEPHA